MGDNYVEVFEFRPILSATKCSPKESDACFSLIFPKNDPFHLLGLTTHLSAVMSFLSIRWRCHFSHCILPHHY